VGLPKGTTHRLVSSLAYFDYTQQDPDSRKYKLGFKLATLGEMVLDQIDLRNEAHPILLGLSQETMEIAHLVVLDNNEALYIDKIQSSREGLQMSSRIGYRAPLHCTAVGKVLLSQHPAEEVDRIIRIKGLATRTGKTIIDGDRFKSHLEKVKREGYALDDEEHSDGVRCVAAPVYNKNGSVVAAISVSAPAVRVTLEIARSRITPLIKAAAQKISNKLGYNP
jgi:DNA-binding IclR family transcriptional regulator